VRLLGTSFALVWVIQQVEWSVVLSAISALPVWAYVIPAGVICVNTVLQSVRLRWVFSALGEECKLTVLLDCLFRGSFVGLALPSGGNEVAKCALIASSGPGMAKSLAAMASVRLLQLPTWIVLLVWGLVSGVLSVAPVLEWAAAVFIGVASMVLVTAALARGSLPEWVPWRTHLERLRADFEVVRSDGPVMLLVASLGAVLAVLNCSVVWALLVAASSELPFQTVLAFVPAADVLIWLPISISGVGVRESAFAMALVPWGVPVASAVAIGITRWTGELARGAIGCMLWILRT